MDRTTIEDLIWRQAEEKLYCTKEEYLGHLRDFEIEPVERDGILIVAWLRKGDELHFFTPKSGKPITRKMFAEGFAPQLEKYGYLKTVTPKSAERQHRFNEAVGFVKIDEDEFNIHYRLDRGRSVMNRSI